MAELNIPTEVKDKSAFSQVDKTARQIIAYAVLMGADNQSAFMRFHPEFIDASGKTMNGAGKQASRQFWSWGKIKDYRQQYEDELTEFLGREKAVRSELSDIDDNRKDKALKALLNRAMSLVEDNAELDPDTLKTLTEIFKKTGLLKDEVEEQEKPRRYLPERCSSCRMKEFVETAVENGDVEDLCQRCRALKIAEEHGFRFNDGKDLLEPIKNEDNNE